MPTIAEEPPNPPSTERSQAAQHTAEPHTAEPHTAEPHTAEPRTAEPQTAEPRTAEPHQHRQIAESFGIDPERYDRTRPRYPDALIERIVAASPGPDLLDVGCGTGTATRQFRHAGRTVLGVEPDARMAEFARGTGLDVEVATFENWEPAGRTFDTVVAGTAWHWVDPVLGAAKAARVLRPGGLLAPFHHVFEVPRPMAEAFATVYQRVVPDSPFDLRSLRQGLDLYQPFFDKVADTIRAAGTFGEPEQWRFDWERSYTRDEWLDQLPTTGAMTRLSPEQVAEVCDGVATAIDELGGIFTVSYNTVAVAATRA